VLQAMKARCGGLGTRLGYNYTWSDILFVHACAHALSLPCTERKSWELEVFFVVAE